MKFSALNAEINIVEPENVTFLWTVALYIQVKIICNIRLGRK
jgi:hypothetical protein